MEEAAGGSLVVPRRDEGGEGENMGKGEGSGDPPNQRPPSPQSDGPMEEIVIGPSGGAAGAEVSPKSQGNKSKWKSLTRFKVANKRGGQEQGEKRENAEDENEAGDQGKSIPLTKKGSFSRLLNRVSQSTHRLLHFGRSSQEEGGWGMEAGTTSTLGRIFSRKSRGGEEGSTRSMTLGRRSSTPSPQLTPQVTQAVKIAEAE